MRIGCKTGGPGDGVSYRGSHGQTVRVGRSDNDYLLRLDPWQLSLTCKYSNSATELPYVSVG